MTFYKSILRRRLLWLFGMATVRRYRAVSRERESFSSRKP